MKTRSTLLALSCALIATTTTSVAQLGGDPTTPPSGAPTRTMKTLDQVEARIPLVDGAPGVSVNAGAFTISASGSYYLVEDAIISSGDGILIAASNVTLDLNGFTISTLADTGASAIRSTSGTPVSSIHIKNGNIYSGITVTGAGSAGVGFDYGINMEGASLVRVSDVIVSGVHVGGIAGAIAIVDSCMVNNVGGTGISADIIRDSIARNCGDNAVEARMVKATMGHSFNQYGIFSYDTTTKSVGGGIGGIVIDSVGISDSVNSSHAGIAAGIIRGSRGEAVAGVGIKGLLTGVVNSSQGISTSGNGISEALLIENSFAESSTAIAIQGASTVSNSVALNADDTGDAINGTAIVIGTRVISGDLGVATEKYLGSQ